MKILKNEIAQNTKERRIVLKTFYGGTFIDKKLLEEADKNYPIKLEYYKNINEDELVGGKKSKFGISVVKTEYMPENTKVETKNIKYLSNDEEKIEKVLEIFKKNQVTPIGVEDVISDLYKQVF